jgi:hypothetical protein
MSLIDRRVTQRRAAFSATVLGGVLMAAAVGGCGKKAASPAAAPGGTAAAAAASGPAPVPPAGPTAHPDAVVDALSGAGLSPEGFAALNPVPYGATACKEGRVQTIDTLVCEFQDEASVAHGETALLEQWGREGGHTGLALHSRRTLLGVFDRARHDPNGKVISRVIETFKKL